MKILHQHLLTKSPFYKKWHSFAYHSRFHLVFVFLYFFISVYIIASALSGLAVSSQLAVCGNSIKEGTEQCDGLSGQSCISLGFSSGSIGCTRECKLDTTQCPGGAPDIPTDNPSCDKTIAANTTHWFKVDTTDPQANQLFYTFSWGDGSTTRAPVNPLTVASGALVSEKHAWSQISVAGYSVTVTATDIGGNTSPVSNQLILCVQ